MYLIGCGAGFSGDRTDAAKPVVDTILESGLPGAIIFETLGERTLALGQVEKQKDSNKGYEPLLDEIITPIISDCLDGGIPIIGNFGAANPPAAARRIQQIARIAGFTEPRIAVVTGDDILAQLDIAVLQKWEGDANMEACAQDLVSANVYLGAQAITAALQDGAQIVVTGRVADPALALGPIMAFYGWAWSDWDRIAQATLAGHLLECGAQVTGGYFADPGRKDVSSMATLGFPIVEMSPDAGFVITKAQNTGGLVDLRTVKEQMLYEIHDPSAYLTPDVILDIRNVQILQQGPNRVVVTGAKGAPPPDTLKTTVGFFGDWLGEGEISYAGPHALQRAKLAAGTLEERFKLRNIDVRRRYDLIGAVSVFDGHEGALRRRIAEPASHDIRLRAALSSRSRQEVDKALQEVMALYCCGPAGGGGIRTRVQNRIQTVSYLVPRDQVRSGHYFV